MKKLLVVLLSLGLVVAFSMSAFAVTPDFTGQYYARGSYISNPSLLDKDNGGKSPYSYADQRLRMFFRLKIVEGVTFTTRMDALETVWGLDTGLRPNSGITTAKANRDYNEQQLSFEQAWVTFATGIGAFDVGYRSGTPYGWGTEFQNATGTAPGIRWNKAFGAVTVQADWFANDRSSTTRRDDIGGVPALNKTDNKNDYYDLGATYKFKDGATGLLLTYFRDAQYKTAAGGYQRVVYNFQPYVKTKIGPVDLEAEMYWMTGKDQQYDDVSTGTKKDDVTVDAKGLYVNGKYNMGPAYVGAVFMYNSGDDQTTLDKKEGSMNDALKYGGNTGPFAGDGPYPVILFGDDYHDFLSTAGGATDPGTRGDNLLMYQVYGGYQITKKLDLNAKLSMLKADKDGYDAAKKVYVSNNYGTELDARLRYKIYDCLSYNVGMAYLWTGDYFKGSSDTTKISNNYMLTHWIDLNF